MKKRISIIMVMMVMMVMLLTGCGEHTYIVTSHYAAGSLESVTVIDTDTQKQVTYSGEDWVEGNKCLTYKDDPALK